mmetsp:Transcript_32120/g.63670  ORF Transcript_32120/g.63670 Transcript_32120/m.63670 type:complete len:91 (+) Transcript_32120:2-274(+)
MPLVRQISSGLLRMGKYYQNHSRPQIRGKAGNKHYFKGNRCRTEGRHTSKGGYVIDPALCLNIVAPDMEGCQLKPYVARRSTDVQVEAAK